MILKKSIYRFSVICISIGSSFLNISHAGIFSEARNAIVHPIAVHYCERHVQKHFSKDTASKVCACTWNKLTSVKGEISEVIEQVTHHKSDKRLRTLER